MVEGIEAKYEYFKDGKTLGEGVRPSIVGDYTVKITFGIKEGGALSSSFDGVKVKGTETNIIEKAYSITKATYNMDEISFENDEVEYDGNPHSIEIEGTLPNGVSVKYYTLRGTAIEEITNVNPGYVDAGTYTVIARFTGDSTNYEAIPEMRAELIIRKASYKIGADEVIYEPIEAIYDGNEHGGLITNANLTAEYEYFKEETTLGDGVRPSTAGTYKVKIRLGIKADGELSKNYDRVEIKDITPATNEVEKTFTIKQNEYDMSKVKFESAEKEYTGEAQKIGITGNLPSGVNVEYYLKVGENETLLDEDNKWPREVGEYEIIARFTGDSTNYKPISDMKATLKINRATYELDTSTLTYEPTSGVYTGNEQGGEITNLVEGIEAKYEYFKDGKTLGEGVRPSIVGDYTVKITFGIKEG
ncbi:MAG: hypothetical protein HFJ50_10270, partial [Clostridia bacterium]|nr:hypothetical protein [Clostridia bacterium]